MALRSPEYWAPLQCANWKGKIDGSRAAPSNIPPTHALQHRGSKETRSVDEKTIRRYLGAPNAAAEPSEEPAVIDHIPLKFILHHANCTPERELKRLTIRANARPLF
jgi:hypothetical protein